MKTAAALQNTAVKSTTCHSKWGLQAKLLVGASNDPLEHDADRVADQVIAASAKRLVGGAAPRIGQFSGCLSECAGSAPPSVDRALAAPGRPLEPALRDEMEQHFGRDFSRVRVYSSAAGDESARDVRAKAYTVGNDIVFGSGWYSLASRDGRWLIAHELAHVVQQAGPARPGAYDKTSAYSASSRAAVPDGPRAAGQVGKAGSYLARAPLPGVSNDAPLTEARTQRIQRAFTPRLNTDARTALLEVMGIIDSVRPASPGSDMYSLVNGAEVIPITKTEYERITSSARKTMLDSVGRVRRKASDAENQYEAQHKIDEDQWFVSGAVRLVGGISDPGDFVHRHVRFARVNANAAQVFIERGQFVRAAEFFSQSETFATAAKKASQAYVDNIISTGDTVVTVLEVTAVAAAITVVAIGVVLAAPLVVPAIANAARAAPLVLSLGTAAPAVPVVVAETAAVAVPAAAAVAGPAAVAVAVPAAAVAVPAAAAALPATAAVAVPAVAASSSLSTAALAATGLAVASTTLSSDSPTPATGEQDKKEKKKRPPFVLRLPQQKAPHLQRYRNWLGKLQSDPSYARGNPGQLSVWHRELRMGGGHGIPKSVYDRGHVMGFAGESGEMRIRVPDWSLTRSTPMEVDHVIELQVTPLAMRSAFNEIDNLELLDRAANGTSGPLLAGYIAAERAKQVAFDPSALTRVLRFDAVEMGGGSRGERWSVESIRAGEQLDAYENQHDR